MKVADAEFPETAVQSEGAGERGPRQRRRERRRAIGGARRAQRQQGDHQQRGAERARGRQHPPHDAEKVITANGRVQRVHRSIPYDDATGEFIGVASFSARGADLLREHYHRRRREFWDKPWREAAQFQKAYLIHLFQDMIEQGVEFGHADTHGKYREIDTQEDMELAQKGWGI